jgi:hypothetical protein
MLHVSPSAGRRNHADTGAEAMRTCLDELIDDTEHRRSACGGFNLSRRAPADDDPLSEAMGRRLERQVNAQERTRRDSQATEVIQIRQRASAEPHAVS